MKNLITILFLVSAVFSKAVETYSKNRTIYSPNQDIQVSLQNQTKDSGHWSFSIAYKNGKQYDIAIPAVRLGLITRKTDLYNQLKLIRLSRPRRINENYEAVHGKRRLRHNQGNETVIDFSSPSGHRLLVTLRVYDDGVAFRYAIPGNGEIEISEEFTGYLFAPETSRWLQKFTTSYEGPYPLQEGKVLSGEWGYPGLFKINSNNSSVCWALISEAGMDGNYCATKLDNSKNKNEYKIKFPALTDGNGLGKSNPVVTLPWKSPWRTIIIGNLSRLTESTLIEDVSPPLKIKDQSWILPGKSSWNYWANNHGTKDFKKVKAYIDLANRMHWTYTLFDWEWDEMGNGGRLEDAVKYANQKGIRPLMWYNSGGPHNKVSSTPRDRILTHESRLKEFEWLKKIGVYGIKVDFFESDKQDMMKYYIAIMEDAARFNLLVNFHGSTVTRGWSRTYPNLMSMEAVFGAEQYNNGPVMTAEAATLNTTLPFTRNVVGSMDYTPVTFTNSQYPHLTSFAHELALPLIFESAIQHLADRPEGYDQLPDEPKSFLREVPTAWDETKLLAGYPGKNVVFARRSGKKWYVGGINGLDSGGELQLPLKMLTKGKRYQATLIEDASYDSAFSTTYLTVNHQDSLSVSWLPRGGFVCILKEME